LFIARTAGKPAPLRAVCERVSAGPLCGMRTPTHLRVALLRRRRTNQAAVAAVAQRPRQRQVGDAARDDRCVEAARVCVGGGGGALLTAVGLVGARMRRHPAEGASTP
jgi:hypothetical protein